MSESDFVIFYLENYTPQITNTINLNLSIETMWYIVIIDSLWKILSDDAILTWRFLGNLTPNSLIFDVIRQDLSLIFYNSYGKIRISKNNENVNYRTNKQNFSVY